MVARGGFQIVVNLYVTRIELGILTTLTVLSLVMSNI